MPTGGLSNESGELSLLVVVVATAVLASTVGVGVATADSTEADPDLDAVIVDGGNYFVGQVLYTGRFGPGDEVSLSYANGTFVSEVSLNQDGDAVVRTGRYGTGEFVLETLDGESIRFEVNPQRYRLDVSSRTVKNGGEDTGATVEIRSNRNRYDHVVTADGLSAEELREVFAVGEVGDPDDDGTEELQLPTGTIERSYDLNFRGVDPGNYTFEFRVLDTDDVATYEFEVGIYPSGNATFDVGSEPLRLQQAAGRTVRGTTSIPDGTGLNVVLRNAGGQGFRRSATTLVANGEFEATFDLTGVPIGQEFVLSVNQQSVVRDEVSGVVVARASLGVADQVGGSDERVELSQVTVPRGGFVAVVVGGDRVLGRTEYLDPGPHSGVVVELDEPIDPARNSVLVEVYEDVDGDRTLDRDVDEPYSLPAGPVTKVLEVVDRTPTATEPNPTTEETETTRDTTEPAATETAAPTTGGSVGETTDDATVAETTTASGGAGPGLGVVAALVGVAATLAVVRYRRG